MGVFPLLDLFLGLMFTYLLLALVCTTLMEWIAQWKNLRGTLLLEGTKRLLGDDHALVEEYFAHPLVRPLREKKKKEKDRIPSYVPGPVFAKALRDVLGARHARQEAITPVELQESLAALRASERATARAAAAAPPEEAQARAEGLDPLPNETTLAIWYDQAMERVSGTYKRNTRWYIIGLAFAVTIALNANTITLANTLWRNPTLRAYMVERAKVRLEQGPPLATVEYTEPENPEPTPPVAEASTLSPNQLLEEEQVMLGRLFGWVGEREAIGRLGVRWGGPKRGAGVWFIISLVGWTITALAVSLGAPFWFDTLNRFMQLRAAGTPPPSTQSRRNEARA
jgi:hypothetical protein